MLTQLNSDACEWTNFKSFFGPDARVYTTWSEYTTTTSFRFQSPATSPRVALLLQTLGPMLRELLLK